MTLAQQALMALIEHSTRFDPPDYAGVFTRFGTWTERTTTCICLETTWVRFSDGSRLKSENGGEWQVAIGRRNERAAWLAAKAELVEVGQDGYSGEVQP